ncbi:MAG: iron ABC transporter permease [Pseudomonadota bacterium]
MRAKAPKSTLSHRFWPVVIIALLASIMVFFASLSGGRPDWQVLAHLLGFAPAGAGDTTNELVLLLRGPRTVAALAIGAMLAASGLILQAVVRNPLAEPGLLGINAGAALSTVSISLGALPFAAGLPLTLAACIGGMLVAIIVYLVSWKSGTNTGRLILAGVGVGALCSGLISLITLFAEPQAVQRALAWLSGSLGGVTVAQAQLLMVFALMGCAALFLSHRQLDVLNLDRTSIVGLGLPFETTRLALLAVAVILASVATAIGGIIAFVGLIAPHAARLLVGHQHRAAAPVAVLVGAALCAFADLAARTVIAPAQLPAGIVTSLLGAPYFLFLMIRSTSGSAAQRSAHV